MTFWIQVLLLFSFQHICPAEGFKDNNIACDYNSSCIFPCSFINKTNDVYWLYITRTEDVKVHSFYENRDQLEDQEPRFKGRTSLVEDKVTRWKTALMLKEVMVQDEGRYTCYSLNPGIHRFDVVMNVDAPVKEVFMKRTGNSITCSSEGIYPEPKLTWSSSLQPNSTVHQTEEKLYNISSSINISDIDEDQLLNCTVCTHLNNCTSASMNLSEERNSIKGTRSHIVAIVVVLMVVLAVMLLICVLCLCKRHKEKLRNNNTKKTKYYRDKRISSTQCVRATSCDPENPDSLNDALVGEVSDSTTASSSSSV